MDEMIIYICSRMEQDFLFQEVCFWDLRFKFWGKKTKKGLPRESGLTSAGAEQEVSRPTLQKVDFYLNATLINQTLMKKLKEET